MGQTIHQESTGPTGAVACLARRVHHILSSGGTDHDLICAVYQKGTPYSVTCQAVVSMLKREAKTLGLQKRGIDPNLIGSHSQRAGGAMALKLQHYPDSTIKIIGRWTSNTWQQYIHNQIAHLAKGVAKSMSQTLPFYNIAFIEPASSPTTTTPPSS